MSADNPVNRIQRALNSYASHTLCASHLSSTEQHEHLWLSYTEASA